MCLYIPAVRWGISARFNPDLVVGRRSVYTLPMERYIIPFDFEGKSHYVFIDKDASRQVYLVGKIMPYTEEAHIKEIPFQAITALDGSDLKPTTLESAIKITLYKFLQARGWLAFAN